MTIGGWIAMIISVSGVTLFFGWSLFKVLSGKQDTSHIHSTMDETPDMDEED